MTAKTFFISVIGLLITSGFAFAQEAEEDLFLEGDVVKSISRAIKKSERIIKKLLDENSIPGIAITVTKDSNTIWQQGYGFADLEKQLPVNASSTLFRVASVSKPLAATGLAKMVADSLIDLNQSLYTYVPYFPKKKYDFTIKQLGGHIAGIRSYKGNEFLNGQPLTIRQGIALFENDSLLFVPGTHYQYSSYNWNLIALAMQEASALPFETYMKENVLLPLRMNNTFADKDSIPNKAVFYTRNEKTFLLAKPVHNYYKLAGGGYLSTSEDLAKLGNAYLKGDFLPANIMNQFLTSQTVNDQLTYYGIGWQVSFDHKNRPFYGHIGNGVGGYAFFYIYPVQRMVFVILLNVTNPEIDDQLYKIIDYMIDGATTTE